VILEHSVLGLYYLSSPYFPPSISHVVHSLTRLCTSIHSSALTQCIHPPCVPHVHLDPSIAPLYLLRYSMADFIPLSTFREKPTIIHVGHYSQPTVTLSLSSFSAISPCVSLRRSSTSTALLYGLRHSPDLALFRCRYSGQTPQPSTLDIMANRL
jgi:hypothetical protein